MAGRVRVVLLFKGGVMTAIRGLVLFLALCCPLWANAMERFEIVTTEQLEQMLADRSAGKADFALVNTLDEMVYRHCSIPGSVNLPWSQVGAYADRLGKDKQRLIVTY